MWLKMENGVGQTKNIFKDVSANLWINLTDEASDFIFQSSS